MSIQALTDEAKEIITNIKASDLPESERRELIALVLYDVAIQSEILTEPIEAQP